MKSKRNARFALQGQSLVETVVAIGVITIVLVALVSAVTFALGNAQFARNKATATKHAQEVVEWLRSDRDAGWPAFSARAAVEGATYCINSLSWPAGTGPCGSGSVIAGTLFARNITVTSNATNDRVLVNVTVSWTQGTRNSNVNIDTYLTKWQ